MTTFPEGSLGNVLGILRTKVEAIGLPDRCTIVRPSGSATVDENGLITWAGSEMVSYQGSTSIPCRFEISRSSRPETLEEQEIIVSEYVFYMPVGVPIETGYVILLTDRHGKVRHFEPRKISNASEWDVVAEVTVEEMMHQSEPA